MLPLIHLYVDTDKGPRKRDGKYLYVLQFISSSGLKAEKIYGDILPDHNENMLVLEAIISALECINKESDIHIELVN